MSIASLQWALGVFLAAVGALMLVAPHQFGAAGYDALRQHLPWWGVSFCLAGAGLLAARVFAPMRWLHVAAHAAAAAALALLAFTLARTSIWSSATAYTLFSLGVLAAGLAPPERARLDLRRPGSAGMARRSGARSPRPRPAAVARVDGDLLSFVLGVNAVANGVLLIAVPSAFQSADYDVIRPQAALYGLAFLASGGALAAGQLSGAAPRPVWLAVHTLAAALYIAWSAIVMWPIRAWTGVALYGGFGALVGLRPWLPGLDRFSRPAALSSSLRARLALALAGTASIPFIVAATLIARQDERAAVDEALAQQQTMAGVLAQDAAQYIGLHRSAVAALAGQMALLAPEPAAQAALLRTVSAAYPALVFLGTFDGEGRGIARSQGRPPPVIVRLQLFEEVRRTGSPAIDVLNRPELAQRPVFALAAPVYQGDRFAGFVLGAVESAQLSDVLARPRVGAGGETYLVDARGRAIAHPDAALVTSLADLSALPPVAALLGQDAEQPQTLRYRGWAGEHLAGYARVPSLGWGIVVERPRSVVLADSYARRDLIFGVLVLAIAAAAVAGVLAAGRLTQSLSALARAADALAAEAMEAPLPQSTTAEVARLAGAFRTMRDRLAARTAEREEAIRLRDNVLATVSHDLKNPLTTIALRAHVLQDEATEMLQAVEAGRAGTPDGALLDRLAGLVDGLGRMLSVVAKMQSMIDELVDTARLHSGQRLDIQRKPMDLVGLVHHVAEEYRQTAERHQVRLDVRANELIGVWDQARLERVLHNLVGNAVKYSPQGGEIVIATGYERAPDGRKWATVAVRDQGLGIPVADLPHVFDRYYRAANVAGRIRGTGLGLSSARQVIEQHGGTIGVESREDEGSTFTVRLPLATAAEEPTPEGGAPWQPAAAGPAPSARATVSGTREG